MYLTRSNLDDGETTREAKKRLVELDKNLQVLKRTTKHILNGLLDPVSDHYCDKMSKVKKFLYPPSLRPIKKQKKQIVLDFVFMFSFSFRSV